MLKKIGLFICVLLGLSIIGILLFAKDVEITLSESQIQTVINQKIKAGPVKSRGVELTINSAIIDFKANDTAEINIDFIADGFGYSGNIQGSFASSIRYEAPKIYLNNLIPVEIEFTADLQTDGKLKDIKNVATDFLKRQKEQMSSTEAKTSLENIVGRNKEALKGFAVSTTYKFFETLPIYDLNNAGIKGSLASLALKNVTFNDTSAVITLSPVQALIKILSFSAFVLLTLGALFHFYMPRHNQSD